MELDVDFLINFFKKHTLGSVESEITEDESAGGSTGGATGGGTSTGKTPKKWESGRVMGKTYGGPGFVWTSGRKDGPTYRFDRKTPWSSGRTMGKTGGSDYA